MIEDASKERAQRFITGFLSGPLGLAQSTHKRLQEASQQFINSGMKDIKFLEAYSKQMNRVEIYLENA